MSDTSTPSTQRTGVPSGKPGTGYVRKMALLILLEIAAAFGLYILFRYRTDYPLLGVNVLTIFLLSLLAGLATRLVLRGRSSFIRVVTGSAVLVIGMTFLGLLSDWRFGFGPLTFSRSAVDWVGAGKLFAAILTFLLALFAWRKPAPVKVAPTPQVAVASPPPSAARPAHPRPKRKTAKHAHTPAAPSRNTIVPAAAKTPEAGTVSSGKPEKPVTKPARRSLFSRKPQVRLAKTEKHICPYCLEPVTRNDPRGVVECEICHTLHHGDCWAIAGVCQVPHYNA